MGCANNQGLVHIGITLGNVIIQNDEFLSDGVDIAGD